MIIALTGNGKGGLNERKKNVNIILSTENVKIQKKNIIVEIIPTAITEKNIHKMKISN